MTDTEQLLHKLRARLAPHTTAKVHRVSGVSEIILRRVRDGEEQNLRLSTIDRINFALDAIEGKENA